MIESLPIVVNSLVARAAELDRRYMLWQQKYDEWLTHPGNHASEYKFHLEADVVKREAEELRESYESLKKEPYDHLPVITGD